MCPPKKSKPPASIQPNPLVIPPTPPPPSATAETFTFADSKDKGKSQSAGKTTRAKKTGTKLLQIPLNVPNPTSGLNIPI